MDYTKIPRALIYKDRHSLDDFEIDNLQSPTHLLYKWLEKSEMVDVPDAADLMLQCFNNAYYICTMILLDKHPVLNINFYRKISEGGLGNETNEHWKYCQSATLSLVDTFLLVSLPNYAAHDNTLRKKIRGTFNTYKYNMGNERTEFFSRIIPEEKIKKIVPDPNNYVPSAERVARFAPRPIDAQAITEATSELNSSAFMASGWRGLTNNFEHAEIAELLSTLCKNEEEKSLMASTIRREVETSSNFPEKEETLAFIDAMKLKSIDDIIVSAKEVDKALMHQKVLELQYEIERMKKQKVVHPQSDDIENSVLQEEIEDTSETIQLKIRIEILNFLLTQAGCSWEYIKENHLVSTLCKLYRLILDKGAVSLLKPNIGKVNYKMKPKGLDDNVKEVNKLLGKINEKWMIEL